MDFPNGLKYSKEHEWVLVEGEVAIVGITEYAQSELGDIVYVELPEVGGMVSKDEPFGSVESVKAVSDIFAPVTGSVTEVNGAVPDSPELVNEDPYGEGWMIKVRMSDESELKELMEPDEYAEYVELESEEDEDDVEDEEKDEEV